MFYENYNLIPKKAFKQHWTQESFSYMESPRPDHGLMLVLNGEIDFISPDHDILSAKAGDILILPKNSYYKARFRIEFGNIDNYLINFETDNTLELTKPMLLFKNSPFSCVDLFRQFIDEMNNVENTDLRKKGLFYLLLDLVINTNKHPEVVSDIVFEKAKTLLKEARDVPIGQIARECAISESGLRKIFSEKIGISPVQFRMKEKFNKAKYLLESTSMSILEISNSLNFYDAAYFCKEFRKQTGLSPKEYRKNKKL